MTRTALLTIGLMLAALAARFVAAEEPKRVQKDPPATINDLKPAEVTSDRVAAENVAVGEADAPAEAQLWKLKEGIQSPACAYVDPDSQTLFISCLGAAATDKSAGSDKPAAGGYIVKADLKGAVLAAKWVADLKGPHGMRSFGGTLWVADENQIVAIDIKTGKVKDKTAIPDAKQLADVAVSDKGVVYASDVLGGKIFELRDGKVSVFVEGDELESPNSLLLHDDKLVVAGWGRGVDPKSWAVKLPGNVFGVDLVTKKKEPISERSLGNLGGLAMDGSGGYFVSDSAQGRVLHLAADGTSVPMFKHPGGKTGDLGMISDKVLILPLTKDNAVAAYDLDKLPQ